MKDNSACHAAIDLHSNNMTLVVLNAQGRVVKHAKLFCELHALDEALQPFRKRLKAVVVESTFNWYWLVDGLEDLGYPVRLANPAGFEPYEGLKHADDRSDARFLAELSRLDILPTGHIYDRRLRPVRDLLRRRALLVGKRTSLLVSLRSLHTRTRGTSVDTAWIKSCKAEELVEHFDPGADRLAAEIEKRHIDALAQSIRRIELEVLPSARSLPHFTKLKTIPGVGDILGMTIAMEAGPIERFATPEDFASYCRAVPAKKMTNGRKKGENNRKCGNRYLAWAFVEAANLIRRYDARAKRWFDRKASRTHKVIATKALACKLAKAAWHILKEGSPYDPDRLFAGKA